jgi:putative PIN family toxin of toxin-antitoxin system
LTVRRRRAVIDTNTFVSAAIKLGSIPDQAIRKALEEDIVLYSEDTWRELQEVLLRPKFDRYQVEAFRRRFLEALYAAIVPVQIVTAFKVCRHPKDDKFLDLAVSGNADLIITGDKDLLVLHPFHGIPIVSPADYLAL